jgi:A/G-specific adenine glycosylase
MAKQDRPLYHVKPGDANSTSDAQSGRDEGAGRAASAAAADLDPSQLAPDALRIRIVEELTPWYRKCRRDLPWRGASPYAVWVSEILLQQTQAQTATPYYVRFLERFPTVQALADASLDDVLGCWAGLGYYARARNLHRAAQIVVERFGGELPRTEKELSALPGIGPYTAGAILSIAFDVRAPLVDANVTRVLARLFGLRGDPGSARVRAALWALADRLVPERSPGEFNQALMELGALVCDPAEPCCEECPLLFCCRAGAEPDPSALPELPPGRRTVRVTHSAAIVRSSGGVLIVRRPPHGLWGGLWEFPRAVCDPGETPAEAAARAAREAAGVEVEIGRRIGIVRHSVTHHRITLHGFEAMPAGDAAIRADRPDLRCVPIDRLNDYPFSSPQSQLRAVVLKATAAGDGL